MQYRQENPLLTLPEFGNQWPRIEFAIEGEKQRDIARLREGAKLSALGGMLSGALLLFGAQFTAQMADMGADVLTVKKA